MRSLFLVRHGNRLDFVEPEWSLAAARPHDPPLSADGMEQVRALAERLRDERIAHVFSSPFLRCIESAGILAEALDAGIKVERGLSEWLSSTWFSSPPETASLGELHARFARIDTCYACRGAAHYGESGEQALQRSGETATRLAADFAGDLLLVGHGASILGAAAGLLGVPANGAHRILPDIPYASLVRLSRRQSRWRLELACDVSHLGCREAVVRYR
jgi:broad specificity phosphatase PhoE